jgi:hypothetical protein
MVATWNVEELRATALPSAPTGTMLGTKDCAAGAMNARAIPNRPKTPNMGSVLPTFVAAKASSSSAAIPCSNKHPEMMRPRSC